MKNKTIKFDIVCGTGQHRTYTACLAELIMLNKYGNQPDYFWRAGHYYDEYVKLIKLTGKISKDVGRDVFSYFIYTNPQYKFDEDIGLFIFNLRKQAGKYPKFSLQELVQIYKNKFRPQITEVEIVKETKAPIKNKDITDFIGDL